MHYQNSIAANVTAWRCGGILCSVCRQLKPIKDIMFNGFYCCLIYNIKLELPMNSELLLIRRGGRPAAIMPNRLLQAVLIWLVIINAKKFQILFYWL